MAEDVAAPPRAPNTIFARADAIASVLNNLIKWGGLAVIFYWIFRSIEVLAGNRTVADIGLGLNFFAQISVSHLLAWILAVGGVGFGLLERNLRRSTIERLQARITALETGVDPGRTTSRLTPRGETNPEDRI